MKQQNYILRTACLLTLLCIGKIQVAAQQGLSMAGLEQMKEQRIWFHSQNAAGTALDDLQNYSDVKLNFQNTSGNFSRPQEGEGERSVGVSSEGFLNLKDAYVWGAFSFSQENKTDAGYNASITDPFRGMPYYVADAYKSSWRNQYYDLKFRAATPLYWGKLAFGLEGGYQASLAAKQRDPRVDTRFYILKLIPGICYAINSHHRLGVNFSYASIKEDSQMANSDSYTDQDYYELFGLGVAVKGIGSGRTTNYYGNQFGGSMQYNYAATNLNLLLEGTYSIKAETAEVSYSTPRKIGSVKDQLGKVAMTLYTKGEKLVHHIKLDASYRMIDGIQYINQRDNTESQTEWMQMYSNVRSTYETKAATLHYSLIRNRGKEYNWRVEALAYYENQKDKYILPYSVKSHENIYMELCGKKNFVLSDKLMKRLLVTVRGGYNKNLSGCYQYGGSHADYLTVTQMETLDANYLMSDYWKLGAAAVYSQQLKQESKTQVFAQVGFDYVKAEDFDFSHRSYLSVSIGCNF